MVKPLGGVPPKRPSFLRIDMKSVKRKLPMPAPFVVSRGYTPEYPWLGQQHPEPAKQAKKPLLLMQQSPASIFKCILCVACFIFGLALIAYAGSAILRGQAARSSLSRLQPRPAAAAPAAEALVQGPEEAASSNVDHIREADKDAHGHGPVTAHELRAEKATTVDDVLDSSPPESVYPSGLWTLGDDDGPDHAADDAPAKVVHGPIVVRMVDESSPEQVAEAEAEAAASHNEELPLVASLVAEPAVGQEEIPVVSVSVDVEAGPGEAVDQEAVQEGEQGAIETTKQLLLMMRMANLAGAQSELMQRAKVTDALKEAYDQLQAAEDAESEQETVQEQVASDGPALYDLLATGDEQDQPAQQEQQEQQEQQLDQAADDELARQLLLWFVTHPEALEEDQSYEGIVDYQPAEEKLSEGVANDHPAEEQEQVSEGSANTPVPAGQLRAELSHDEDHSESVVPWTQLNEDDKQDALLPKLAARGLDGDDLPATDSSAPTPIPTEPKEKIELKPEIQEDVELTDIVPRAAPEQEQQEVDESHQIQQYRDLLARRLPLMHHVLQLRRSQQESLQQEQRATAYLQLLDIHLLQHQQEAAARQRRRQHLRDMQRLQDFAQQTQQQDQQLYAQQVWWGQQAYAQQAGQDQQLYSQQTYSGAGVAQADPVTQQQGSATHACPCPHHRIARTTQMSYEQPQSAW